MPAQRLHRPALLGTPSHLGWRSMPSCLLANVTQEMEKRGERREGGRKGESTMEIFDMRVMCAYSYSMLGNDGIVLGLVPLKPTLKMKGL